MNPRDLISRINRSFPFLFPALCFLAIVAAYLWRSSELLLSPHQLWHDNYSYHFASFFYFANSLAHDFGFPRLFLDFGGSEVAISAIATGCFAPHRLIAYLLYLLSPLSPVACFKAGLAAGLILNATGWQLFWRRTFRSQATAAFCTLLFFASGIGVTIWHQEQVLFTLSYLPWALLACLHARENPRYLPLAAALLASLFTLHYPQIHLLALSILALLLLAHGIRPFSYPVRANSRAVILAAFAGLLALAPSIYIWWMHSDYASPVRASAHLAASSLQEYLAINRQQRSSATLAYLGNIFWPDAEVSDDRAMFFVSFVALYFAMIGLVIAIRQAARWRAALFFTLAAAWASLGVNGGAAQFFYTLHFPLISAFRQWYHFSTYVILGFITLAGLGFRGAYQALERKRRIPVFLVLAALSAVFLWTESNQFFLNYSAKFNPRTLSSFPRYSKDEFLLALNQGKISVPLPSEGTEPLIALRTSIELYRDCPEARRQLVWPAPATVASSTSEICAQLKDLRSTDFPLWVTPTGLQRNPAMAAKGAALVAVNTALLQHEGEANPKSYGKGSMSLVAASHAGDIQFAGGLFPYLVALQLGSIFFAALWAWLPRGLRSSHVD